MKGADVIMVKDFEQKTCRKLTISGNKEGFMAFIFVKYYALKL